MAKAVDNTIYCGPCESQHLTNVADLWCPNCDEGLCSKCMEYHKVLKSSRVHKTITIENLTTLPDFVRNIDHLCSSHDNALELYCSVNEETCCADCVSFEHFECPEVAGMKDTSVKMELTNEISGLEQELIMMGNLEIIKVSTDMPFPGVKSQLAKCLYDIQSGIDHIKLNYLSHFQLPFDTDINICGCVILDDERVIMANKNSNNSTGGLHIFRESGEYLERIFCPSKPSGILIINGSSIAVAFCDEYCIKVYDSENFKIKQKPSRGYYFCGLSVESEWLVSAIRDDGIYFIKCSDGNILKVLPSYIEHLSYVNIKRGNTLVSDEKKHSVHCLNRDGETIWTFSSRAMKGPKDICTDAFGNIFVAACDSQSLIAISSDGKPAKNYWESKTA
ncbi:Hypothetical predicted protein [Mytilus galloprovincialis]|uniref:B box-type domain-containing protein n=1 Tax=Mytilus galloprovincialis TaxID=29158 RepID=A0A8B6BDW1_MYTGA|nr:Hypothetical predicted protein [Mytilus galloprovincialis]